jgi:hypothetical protein
MHHLLDVVFSPNNSGGRVWLLRSATRSVTTGDERWIKTVLKDPHPVVTQRVSGVDTHNSGRDVNGFDAPESSP